MTETKTEPKKESSEDAPALSVNYIEYGRVFNLREHRNERIKIGAVIDAGQLTGEEGMILLFEKVECLHGAFQHWRKALGQVYAANEKVESKDRAIRTAEQNVEDQKQRAKELEHRGKPKQAECALEDIGTLEARVDEAKQEHEDAKIQYYQAVQTKDEIANALRNGEPAAALGIPLDPNLTSYDIEVVEQYHRDYY